MKYFNVDSFSTSTIMSLGVQLVTIHDDYITTNRTYLMQKKFCEKQFE